MFSHTMSHLAAWLPIILLGTLLLLTFEIWMIVDVAIKKKLSDKAKAWWIIGMMLVHPIVAIVYFFTDHKKK